MKYEKKSVVAHLLKSLVLAMVVLALAYVALSLLIPFIMDNYPKSGIADGFSHGIDDLSSNSGALIFAIGIIAIIVGAIMDGLSGALIALFVTPLVLEVIFELIPLLLLLLLRLVDVISGPILVNIGVVLVLCVAVGGTVSGVSTVYQTTCNDMHRGKPSDDADKDPVIEPYFMNQAYPQLYQAVSDCFENCYLKASRLATNPFSVAAAMPIVVFGMLVCIIFSLLLTVIFLVPIGGFAIAVTVVAAREAATHRHRGTDFVCDSCKSMFDRPGYVCPSCGAVHANLYPNTLGILTHRCACGQRLPSTYTSTATLGDGNKIHRSDLRCACPNHDCEHKAAKGEYQNFCISVVGATSSGKTAYTAAVTHELLQRLGRNGFRVVGESFSKDSSETYQLLKKDFARGATDLGDNSSVSAVSFGVDGPRLRTPRMVHIFDVAGKSFIAGDESEDQLQYGYDGGYVLMVDPFSIEDVDDELGGQLSANPKDRRYTSHADPGEALNALVAKAQRAKGLGYADKLDVPLAVVLGKIDEVGLSEHFGEDARTVYLSRHPGLTMADAEDAMVRQFLQSHGMGKLIVGADTYFASNRFFAVSSIGHTRDHGAFQPQGVLEPVQWIVNQSDTGLAKAFS